MKRRLKKKKDNQYKLPDGLVFCDPDKNKECKKTSCHIYGGPCFMTHDKNCQKMYMNRTEIKKFKKENDMFKEIPLAYKSEKYPHSVTMQLFIDTNTWKIGFTRYEEPMCMAIQTEIQFLCFCLVFRKFIEDIPKKNLRRRIDRMKKLIIANRLSGKTRELIERCNEDRYSIIVCPTRDMCRNTFNMAQDLKMPIPMPITFAEFAAGKFFGRNIDKFYFDELQMSIGIMARGIPIDTIVIDTTAIDIIERKSAGEKQKPIIHELKILPKFFNEVMNYSKQFELRKDDRDFQEGDWIYLKEFENGQYTGRESNCFKINYILRNCPEYGLEEGYCILGFN